jgi:hypothetical protein
VQADMPTYCYKDDRGKVHEQMFPVGKAPRSMHVNGRHATRCYQAERVGVPATKGWPITCVASGVNASQAGELKEYLAKRGVPTEVTRDGDPIYRDASHRRKALKARGLVDKSSYV